MTSDLGEPLGHREIIRRINAQKAAEAKARLGHPETEDPSDFHHTPDDTDDDPSPSPERCRISAFRHETTGQFYAMSREDRQAFNEHCQGLISDLQPANHHERWLATSIAEDQWRLNRARALESNIFAISMSSPTNDFEAGDPETHAAISQARTWLAEGTKLQNLALYESRIRRSIEKNEKQLKQLQTERKAAYNKALEEEILLAELAIAEGETYEYESIPGAKTPVPGNGFGFSTEEIIRQADRRIRLRRAMQLQKPTAKPAWPTAAGPQLVPKKVS